MHRSHYESDQNIENKERKKEKIKISELTKV